MQVLLRQPARQFSYLLK